VNASTCGTPPGSPGRSDVGPAKLDPGARGRRMAADAPTPGLVVEKINSRTGSRTPRYAQGVRLITLSAAVHAYDLQAEHVETSRTLVRSLLTVLGHDHRPDRDSPGHLRGGAGSRQGVKRPLRHPPGRPADQGRRLAVCRRVDLVAAGRGWLVGIGPGQGRGAVDTRRRSAPGR
jgi:hypothetical protein